MVGNTAVEQPFWMKVLAVVEFYFEGRSTPLAVIGRGGRSSDSASHATHQPPGIICLVICGLETVPSFPTPESGFLIGACHRPTMVQHPRMPTMERRILRRDLKTADSQLGGLI
jgi:hypothetical protein